MSLDGFVAGPNHSHDWMTGVTFRAGLVQEYTKTTGAVLGGRSGVDAYVGSERDSASPTPTASARYWTDTARREARSIARKAPKRLAAA
jgi:hypothetical protein